METVTYRILVVDDDPIIQEILEVMLKEGDYEVDRAGSGREAIDMLSCKDKNRYDCVITDNHMADIEGQEVIKWINKNLPDLSAIMMTADNESSTVRKSFRGGAVDFLRKPLQQHSLYQSVSRAIDITKNKRNIAATRAALHEINAFQQYLVENIPENLPYKIELCNHPRDEIGGDSITFFPISEKETVIILVDVSGHDLKAGFISTFFRGILRGMLQKGANIIEIIEHFNDYLLNEWSQLNEHGDQTHVVTSLCVSAIVINHETYQASVVNSGLPPVNFCSSQGIHHVELDQSSCPLGWFKDNIPDISDLYLESGSSIYLWSDGIEDLAISLDIDPLTLTYHMIDSKRKGVDVPYLKNAADDISLIKISNPTTSEESEGSFFPIVSQTYTGEKEREIDYMQKIWEESVRFVLPDVTEDRISDILLCLREITLNAMQYGCQGSPDKSCSLQIAYNPKTNSLQTYIKDPGEGHNFDYTKEINIDDHSEGHVSYGLSLVHAIADKFELTRNGAHVKLLFKL